MPRRRTPAHQPSIWNAGTVVNIFAIPIITTIFLGGGAYFTFKALLEQNTSAIKEESAKREEAFRTETTKREAALKEEVVAREALRQALMENSKETTKGIASLAAHALVQDEQIKNATTELKNVVNGLQNIEIAVGRPSRIKQ